MFGAAHCSVYHGNKLCYVYVLCSGDWILVGLDERSNNSVIVNNEKVF